MQLKSDGHRTSSWSWLLRLFLRAIPEKIAIISDLVIRFRETTSTKNWICSSVNWLPARLANHIDHSHFGSPFNCFYKNTFKCLFRKINPSSLDVGLGFIVNNQVRLPNLIQNRTVGMWAINAMNCSHFPVAVCHQNCMFLFLGSSNSIPMVRSSISFETILPSASKHEKIYVIAEVLNLKPCSLK